MNVQNTSWVEVEDALRNDLAKACHNGDVCIQCAEGGVGFVGFYVLKLKDGKTKGNRAFFDGGRSENSVAACGSVWLGHDAYNLEAWFFGERFERREGKKRGSVKNDAQHGRGIRCGSYSRESV